MNARYFALAILGFVIGCASTPIGDTAPLPAETPQDVVRYPACDPAPWGREDAPRQGGEASAEVTSGPG